MDIEIARENLSLVKAILDKNNITFWLSWGTCLGAIREKSFIADDYDTDIEVSYQDGERILALIPAFEACGFKRYPSIIFGIQLKRKKEQIDIFFAAPVKEKQQITGWVTGSEFLEADFLSQQEEITFFGETYKVPKNPTAYIQYVYGPTWQQKINNYWYDSLPKETGVNLEVRQENLHLIKEIFVKHNIRFWLANTTCIEAISKTKEHIDDRIYLGTYSENKEKILAILPELNQLGFIGLRTSYIKRYSTTICRHNEFIEIQYVWKPELEYKLKGYRWIDSGVYTFAEDFFTQLENTNFLGEEYYLPHQPQKYLSRMYGASFWQETGLIKLKHQQRVDLLTQKLQQQSKVEIALNINWLPYIFNYYLLIPYGDAIALKKLDIIHPGMIVLVLHQGTLAMKRVLQVTVDGICLTSDIRGQNDIWLTAENAIAQVSTHYTRWGVALPLDSKAMQILIPVIMPVQIIWQTMMNRLVNLLIRFAKSYDGTWKKLATMIEYYLGNQRQCNETQK